MEAGKVEIEGGDQLARGLKKVADELGQLDQEADAVGKLILAAAKARAPVRTGQLAASGTSKGSGVTFSAPYAPPIHWGWAMRGIQPNPFAWAAAERTEPAWLGVYTDMIQDDLDKVKGA
jgi:hypothetical protein